MGKNITLEEHLNAIRDLIDFEKKRMREYHGYIGNNTRLIGLSDKQAKTALRYGIPIGICSQYDDYHGSHKGEYYYYSVMSMKQLQEMRKLQIYDDYTSISPFLPDPQKMLGYLKQIGGIERFEAMLIKP